MTDRERWNEKYRAGGPDKPSVFLMMHQARLTRGKALDLAGGCGENSAILAMAGWQVTYADVSDEAISRARKRVGELRTDVQWVHADALRLPFKGPFDTIVVINYLERTISKELIGLLAPGGTIFAETYLKGLPDPYLIKSGEWAKLFAGLEVVLDKEVDDKSVFIGKKAGG